MSAVIAIAVIVAILLDVLVAYEFSNIALAKGYENNMKYMLYCIFCTIAGWLMVVALPDKNTSGTSATNSSESNETVPFEELPPL